MKFKHLNKIILLIIVVAVVVAVYFFFFNKKEQVSYMTVPVTRGDINRVVNATGEVGAQQLVSVGAQVSGQIEKLYVTLGQTVKKGDLIAQIDSTTQRNDLEINKAKLQSLQAQLEAAQVALKVRKSQYDREIILDKGNATSKENLENAENNYVSALSQVADLESMITQTQISLNTAEVNLGYTTISAPQDGTIVSIPVEEGQTINANQTTPTIVEIADLTKMEILLEISEGDITKVKPGMPVSYTILSEPEKVFQTTLFSIDPGSTALTDGRAGTTTTSTDAVYYYGRLRVANNDGNLHIGMTAQSVITVASAAGVLMVPTMVISANGPHKSVSVMQNGQPVKREVTTGLADNMYTEIVAGLEEGEEVVSTQMTSKQISDSMSSGMGRPRF